MNGPSLDAGEVVSLSSEEILSVIGDPQISENGFWIKRRNFFLDRFLTKGGQYPDATLRLYRRGFGRLPCRSVHEQAEVDGKVGHLQNDLLHYADPDFDRYLTRNNRYTSLMAQELAAAKLPLNAQTFLNYFLIKPITTFFSIYCRHRASRMVFLALFLPTIPPLASSLLTLNIMAKNKKLKIAIDVSPLSDGNAKRGVGIFTRQLVAALKKEISSNPEYSDFQINYIENWNLDFENYSLVHYPFFDPFFPTLPRRQNIPTIVTVYDLIPRQFKRHFPVGLKGELTWLGQKRRLKSSDYLLTCSHYSKYAIHQITRYPLDRIYVTPGAASRLFPFKPIIGHKKAKAYPPKISSSPKVCLLCR